MAPGIIAGSLVGPQIVGAMSPALLSSLFGVFVVFAATNIWLDRQPKPTHKLPGRGGLIAVGTGIGMIASMVGAGGAFMTVPFMTACNVPIRNCVATSAAVGLRRGGRDDRLRHCRDGSRPAAAIGTMRLTALFVIVAMKALLAGPSAKERAPKWPIKTLKRSFAFVLYALAGYMLWRAWG
jgi:uncharacterized membrane protein YfcA